MLNANACIPNYDLILSFISSSGQNDKLPYLLNKEIDAHP